MMVWRAWLADWFNFNLPVLRRKQSAFEIEDLPGLWRIHWQLGKTTILSTFYTRIDQACLLWGIISAVIFLTAQFASIDWGTQAILWSSLTVIGTLAMTALSRYWRTVEPLSKVINIWIILMLAGLLLTDFSIFFGWSHILGQLCSIWLALDAIGYFYTAWKMRSRAFAGVGLAHLVGIGILPHLTSWQFLVTGLLTGISALLLAEFQWDSGDICAHLANRQNQS